MWTKNEWNIFSVQYCFNFSSPVGGEREGRESDVIGFQCRKSLLDGYNISIKTRAKPVNS